MTEFADERLVTAVLEDAEWITIAVWEQRREGHCCQPGCFEVVEWDFRYRRIWENRWLG